MGMLQIFESGGDDLNEFKKAVKMAKEAVDMICELTDEMEDKYSERGGYGERYGERSRSMRRDEIGEWGERRGRDSMGRYTRM